MSIPTIDDANWFIGAIEQAESTPLWKFPAIILSLNAAIIQTVERMQGNALEAERIELEVKAESLGLNRRARQGAEELSNTAKTYRDANLNEQRLLEKQMAKLEYFQRVYEIEIIDHEFKSLGPRAQAPPALNNFSSGEPG